MREQPVVLIVQDTTELDYTQHPAKDARCLNTEQRFGLYEHVLLAVTPDKLCLGVVGQSRLIARQRVSAKRRNGEPCHRREGKFSLAGGISTACQLAVECPGTQIVSVADREADIYDIFVDAQQQSGPRAEYIIRAKEDRSTLERDPESGPGRITKYGTK